MISSSDGRLDHRRPDAGIGRFEGRNDLLLPERQVVISPALDDQCGVLGQS